MKLPPMRLAVFASGSGSNLEAILEAASSGELAAEIVLVVSNKPQAGALERARQRDVATLVSPPGDFDSEDAYLKALDEQLQLHGVNFIALAGYLKKIPSELVAQFRGRMLNIHPSLLPSFGGPGMYGLRVHEAAIEAGVRWSGATVHLVDEGYDTGPIILQKPVPVHPGDSVQDLAARILAVEHRLYPEALRLFSEGRIQVDGRKVKIDTSIPNHD